MFWWVDLDSSLGGVTGGPVLWGRVGFKNAVSKTGMVGGGAQKGMEYPGQVGATGGLNLSGEQVAQH